MNRQLTPHSPDEARQRLNNLPGWELLPDGKWISQRFTFTDFLSALDFVNKAGALAEEAGHHPDITLGWGYAVFTLQTHDAGGLTEKDFSLAEKINGVATS